MKEQNVILVDENDNQIGLMPKMEAHSKGLLHRAFSVFILNGKNELMLQKRSINKYHSPGLWTNTCCSHPNEGESVLSAGRRRLNEEMGIYTEYELDHVLIGNYYNDPIININEVSDWKWMSIGMIEKDIKINPLNYTVWFKIIFEKFLDKIH